MGQKASTRIDIIRSSLSDISLRLADLEPTDDARALRKRMARYEKILQAWDSQAPGEAERANLMNDVLELNLAVMKLSAESS